LSLRPSDTLYLAWAGVSRITPFGRVAGPEARRAVGDVRVWHFSDIPPALTNVRYRG
jgi:hypothetical protein